MSQHRQPARRSVLTHVKAPLDVPPKMVFRRFTDGDAMTDDAELSDLVFRDRYALPGEASRAATFQRVAAALAAVEKASQRHGYAALYAYHFMRGAIGAGRIMANAGTARNGTMVNCFVQPAAMPGLPFPAAVDPALDRAVRTLAMGGGIGYDFTPVPPKNATHGGPCGVIDRYDAVCRAQLHPDGRPGAQMAVLACDHPDLLEYIDAKQGRRRWQTFNVSVAATDAFLGAVERDEAWTLRHPSPPVSVAGMAGAAPDDDGRRPHATVPAREVWDRLTRAAWHSGEPGILFVDTINAANNLHAIETLRATNPCGEQPLPPYGSCVLGPINVSRYVHYPFGLSARAAYDFVELGRRVRVQVRLLDNVLDLTRWPLDEHAAEARAKRRIGIGMTGLGDALLMMGLRYDDEAGRTLAAEIARCMRDHAYLASAELAGERGAFPCYRPESFLDTAPPRPPFPPDVLAAIRRHGLRNSHLLSFAPAGSVSVAFFDNCSSGIEPPYAWRYTRQVHLGREAPRTVVAENAAWRLWQRLKNGRAAPLPAHFLQSAEIRPEDHLAMLTTLQPWVDAAISKTVPLPANSTPGDVGRLFLHAWHAGAKGLTVFRPDPSMPSPLGPSCPGRETPPAQRL